MLLIAVVAGSAPYVPHLIYDYQHLPDGNVLGFSYACVAAPLQLFSFNLFARKPTLGTDQLQALVKAQNDRVGGLFKVDGIRYADADACKWK